MNCHFYISDKTIYSPKNRTVNGTIVLSSKQEVNGIQLIEYGIKSESHLLIQYQDTDGMGIIDPVLYEYCKDQSKGDVHLQRLLDTMESTRGARETYLSKFNLIQGSHTKFSRSDDGNWKLPKKESAALEFTVSFPSPFELDLPSTTYKSQDLKMPHSDLVHIKYYLYVKVSRMSNLLKRTKTEEFKEELLYQSSNQYPDVLKYVKYARSKIFHEKRPRPELIDKGSGHCECISYSTSHKPKFLNKLFSQNKEKNDIKCTMVFSLMSVVSLYEPLYSLFNVSFIFDLARMNFPSDFQNGSSSNGLGLFKIAALEIYIVYEKSFAAKDEIFSSFQQPQKVHEFLFQDLIFDIKDCAFDPKTDKGLLEVSAEAFKAQEGCDVPLIQVINKPLLCSCHLYGAIKNTSTLHFVWSVIDTDNKLKFTFQTKSAIDC